MPGSLVSIPARAAVGQFTLLAIPLAAFKTPGADTWQSTRCPARSAAIKAFLHYVIISGSHGAKYSHSNPRETVDKFRSAYLIR
jgi:hypothetical protein